MVKLLIVDDEEIIRSGLNSIKWEEYNIKVVATVSDGFDAIEILESELIDILLTDIRMPGVDGLQLANFIQEHHLQTAVILLSGFSDFEYAKEAIQKNVFDYLVKPSSPEEILKSVERAKLQINENRSKDLRLRLLEAELGKKQLVIAEEGIVLGEIEYSDITERVFKYINNNFNKHVSLSDLSKELYYSSVYLSKVIKKDTGYTFLDLLNGYRSYVASEKLRLTEMTLEDICLYIGINDPRYFCQLFKRYYSVSPSKFKKNPQLINNEKLSVLIHIIAGLNENF